MSEPSHEGRQREEEYALVRQHLENERKSIELQQQQHEFSLVHDEREFELAKDALSRQSEDLKDRRRHDSSARRDVLNVSVIILVVFLIALIVLAAIGQAPLAQEILKTIVLLGGGGGAGYAAGRYRKTKDDTDSQDE